MPLPKYQNDLTLRKNYPILLLHRDSNCRDSYCNRILICDTAGLPPKVSHDLILVWLLSKHSGSGKKVQYHILDICYIWNFYDLPHLIKYANCNNLIIFDAALISKGFDFETKIALSSYLIEAQIAETHIDRRRWVVILLIKFQA